MKLQCWSNIFHTSFLKHLLKRTASRYTSRDWDRIFRKRGNDFDLKFAKQKSSSLSSYIPLPLYILVVIHGDVPVTNRQKIHESKCRQQENIYKTYFSCIIEVVLTKHELILLVFIWCIYHFAQWNTLFLTS